MTILLLGLPLPITIMKVLIPCLKNWTSNGLIFDGESCQNKVYSKKRPYFYLFLNHNFSCLRFSFTKQDIDFVIVVGNIRADIKVWSCEYCLENFQQMLRKYGLMIANLKIREK